MHIIELSFEELCEGHHLWLEIVNRLISDGYALRVLNPGHSSPRIVRMLNMDRFSHRQNS